MTTVNNCNNCTDEVVHGCTNCCKTCPDCPNCYDLDIEKIREYLFAIDEKISDYNQSAICISDWGYACKPVTYDQFEKLIIFRDYIDHYYNALRLNCDSGICPDEIQKVLEATSKLVSLNFRASETYSNVEIDDSKFDEWVIDNPYCVAWEDWEYHIAQICPKLGFKVISVQDACRLVYDLKVDEIQNSCQFLYTLTVASIAKKKSCIDVKVTNLIKCNLNYTAAVNSIETCDISFEAKAELIQCKLNYDVLVKQHKCSFDFNTYVKLLSCNLSHEVISSLLECNVDVKYSVENKCPVIVTNNGEYNLNDLDYNLFRDGVDPNSVDTVFGIPSKDFYKNNVKVLVESYTEPHLINIEIDE